MPGIETESETQVTSNGANQMVDARALSEAIVEGVFARIPQSAPVQQAPAETRKSIFEEKAAALLQNEKIDQPTVSLLLDLIGAVKEDVTREQAKTAMEQALKQQESNVHERLFGMVERYSAGDKKASKAKVLIVNDSIEEYNRNSTNVANWSRGIIDFNQLDKLIAKNTNEWLSDENKQKSPGGPAIKNDAPADATVKPVIDPNNLSGQQLEFFTEMKHFWGKQPGFTPDKAREKALAQLTEAETRTKSKR